MDTRLQTQPHDALAWPKCKPHGNPQWHCDECLSDLDALIVERELAALERVRDRSVDACAHELATTPANGHGSYCTSCGETLS